MGSKVLLVVFSSILAIMFVGSIIFLVKDYQASIRRGEGE